MIIDKKILIVLGSVLLLVISFSLGYYATPTKTIVKQVVKTETVKVEGKTRIVYRNKVTLPNGTITENEVEKEETNTKEESKSVATFEKLTVKDLGLTISALAVKPINDLNGETGGQIVLSKRLLGAVNITTSATVYKNDKLLGVGVGWSF